jgi:hypothetical protein
MYFILCIFMALPLTCSLCICPCSCCSVQALLSKPEEEAVIAQADARLKAAKGRAMLPALSRKDVLDIFQVRYSLWTRTSFLYRHL